MLIYKYNEIEDMRQITNLWRKRDKTDVNDK